MTFLQSDENNIFCKFSDFTKCTFVTICVIHSWKWNATYLRSLKFTEETLMFTQCTHYAGITIFQKIIKTSGFAKVVNFHQNRKC